MEKKGVFGPGDCEETIEFANNLPYLVADIVRKYGYNVNPDNITTPSGVRYSASNLDEGIAIPGIKTDRRGIRRDILNEIGKMPVIFVTAEKQSEASPYQQRQITEYFS